MISTKLLKLVLKWEDGTPWVTWDNQLLEDQINNTFNLNNNNNNNNSKFNLNNKPKPNGLKLPRMVNGSSGPQPTNTGTLSTNSTTTQPLSNTTMLNLTPTLPSKFKPMLNNLKLPLSKT
jgi:hypothetical protein